MAFYDTGKVIKALRKQQGLTQEQLSAGIMDVSNLSRIESGKIAPSKLHLNIIMERLGFNADTFISDFVDSDESHWLIHKNQAITAIIDNDIAAAQAHIKELEANPIAKTEIGKQLLEHFKLSIQNGEERHTVSRKLSIINTLKITIPNFKEDKISEYFLSRNEIFMVNQLGLYYANNNNKLKGIAILKALAQGIREHYVDKHEKAISLPLVLYNLSKYLGQCGFYHEAIEVCDEGIEICVNNNKLKALPKFIFNKAYCLNLIDKSIDCKSLVYQAYYGCIMSRKFDDARIYKQYAESTMGIVIDD